MVVFFNDYPIYNLLRDHIKWLFLMLKWCRHIELYLNIKKIIFVIPVGILLGHVVCKEGIKVNLTKVKVNLDLKPLVNPKKIHIFLGHTWYYRKFIQQYSNISFSMDGLLKANVPFNWTNECTKSFEILKCKIVEAPILRFPNWCNNFHVHIDAFAIAVGAFLI